MQRVDVMETCLDTAGLKLMLETDWTKVWTKRLLFDFIETCLDTAGLKLILEEG